MPLSELSQYILTSLAAIVYAAYPWFRKIKVMECNVRLYAGLCAGAILLWSLCGMALAMQDTYGLFLMLEKERLEWIKHFVGGVAVGLLIVIIPSRLKKEYT